MRHFILILQILFIADSAIASDEKSFAEIFLASMYTDDDSIYRSLLHPVMEKCANRMWNQKSGNPPREYEYKITEANPQTIKNEQAMARMFGINNASFLIEPTHEIAITTEYKNEYPQGHPCYSRSSSVFTSLLVRDSGDWKITSLCVPQDAADMLDQRKIEGLAVAEERSKKVDGIYASLNIEQRNEFESKLFDNKVKAIYAYSEALDVDITTAKAFREKVCAVYPQKDAAD